MYFLQSEPTTTMMQFPFMAIDPEIFFVDHFTGKIASSETVLRGNSLKIPHRDSSRVQALSVEIDGIQAEFHCQPFHCREWTQDSLFVLIKSLDEMLLRGSPKIYGEPGQYSLCFDPVVEVDLRGISQSDFVSAKSFISGCNPDLNAYTKKENTPRVDYQNWLFREAGGHIAFLTTQNLWTSAQWVKRIKALDGSIGILSVLLTQGCRKEAQRRKVFGRAGDFRFKQFKCRYSFNNFKGIEYRTLSNFWLRSPMLYSLLAGLGREIVQEPSFPVPVNSKEVQEIINENDLNGARKYWESFVEIYNEWKKNKYYAIGFAGFFGELKRFNSLKLHWPSEWNISVPWDDVAFHGGTARGFLAATSTRDYSFALEREEN